MTNSQLEVWLRGPLPDIPQLLQPVAHAILQAREEVESLMHDFPEELLWIRLEGQVASAGFHLQHLSGVLDRLFTYARGKQLTAEQLTTLQDEGQPAGINIEGLVAAFRAQVDRAIQELRTMDVSTLTEPREVGRGKLPSTVLGLLVHAAEHTQRHVGQLLVTVRVLPHNQK
jgi:uncharacterized damage-inducible protein DinB